MLRIEPVNVHGLTKILWNTISDYVATFEAKVHRYIACLFRIFIRYNSMPL